MTNCKRLYCISELLSDDLSLVATGVKIFHKEEHKVILNHLINGDVDRYSLGITILYELSCDSFNIDGMIALIEAVHKHSAHGTDQVRSNVDTGIIIGDDLKKGARLSLFGDE